MKRLKTITSHAGYARWLAETSEQPISWIARCDTTSIPSPYAYSPSTGVYRWNDHDVVSFEVRHKRYEIYEVPAGIQRFATDELATDRHIKR